MTRYLFSSLLLLLLVSCALCGVVSADGTDLFEAEKGEVLEPTSASNKEYDIEEVASPSMAGDDGIVLGHVLAKIKTSNQYIIFTRFIETGDKWVENTTDKKNWKSQVATAPGSKQTIAFGTVKKGTNFYTLYAHRSDGKSASDPWEFELATGAITDDAGGKKITWTKKEVKEAKVTIKDSLINVTPMNGSAFLIEDKPVFVLRGKKDGGDKEIVFAIARMDGAGADDGWTFTFEEMKKDCDATFFSLGKKIFMAPKGESCAEKDLKEWDDSKKWVAPTEDIAEDLKTQKVAGDFFLPIKIDGKDDVLLITEKKENAKTAKNTDFFLHVAKGKHIAKLPKAIIENAEDTSDASLFYAKDQLFFLSQRGAKVVLERLEDTPAEIKKVLEGFEQKDKAEQVVPGPKVDPDQKNKTNNDPVVPKGGTEPTKKKDPESSVHERVSMGVVLLCALFGMMAPLAL